VSRDNALDLMLHATGGSGTSKVNGETRNYFCVEVDGDCERIWRVLVDLRMARRGREINDGRDVYYVVTPLGYEFLSLVSRDAGGRKAVAR